MKTKIKAAIMAVLVLVACVLAAIPIMKGDAPITEKIDVAIDVVDKGFDAVEAVEAVVDEVRDELSAGESIEVTGTVTVDVTEGTVLDVPTEKI